jgi:acetoin utilization protein AcuB
MRVDEWMRRERIAIDPGASLADAERVMTRHGLRQLPVARGSALVGLVDDVALAAARPSPATTLTVGEILGHLATIPVSRLMRRDPLTVAPSTPVEEAARLLRDHELSVLPVVQHGNLVGILVDVDLLSMVLS